MSRAASDTNGLRDIRDELRNDLRNTNDSDSSAIEEGNVNSFSNFVSSFQRAQSFTTEWPIADEETSLLADSTARSRRTSAISTISLANKNSTVYQTIFNAINVLIGIALLSLPYALRLSGFWIGSVLLIISFLSTNETAKILGSIMKLHPELITYGDIAGYSGGKVAQFIITALFLIDITGASLIVILLFSDTFSVLFDLPGNFFKILITVVVFVLSFFPLNILSLISLTGVVGTFSLLFLIVICGFITNIQPGSLLSPMKVKFWPDSYIDVVKSLGMFMAPWGGHPIYPEFYHDMRHPNKYNYACNVSFTATFIINYLLAIVGFLMYGIELDDSIIKNLMANSNYPNIVKLLLLIILGVLPILKLPLLVKPVIRTFETQLNLGTGGTTSLIIRILYFTWILILSIIVKSFGKVVAFLGAAICFSLCLIFPLYFKLVVFKHELNFTDKTKLWISIAVGIIGGVLGTIGSVLD